MTRPRPGRRLGPFLCWAVVFADIGTSVYYTPGILYRQVGVHAALFVTITLAVFVLLSIKVFEIIDSYRDDAVAQAVFAVAEATARKARLDSRFIYVHAGAPAGTADWLVTHMAPQETIMLDDGAGLASADRFALEREKVGDATVPHYRAKPG